MLLNNLSKQKIIIVAICVLVFIFALGLTFYPLIANQYNTIHQSEIYTEYEEQIQEIENAEITQMRLNAINYNQALVPGVAENDDAFSIESIGKALESYKEQLDPTGNGLMGYVEVPTIGVKLPIYHGTTDATLEIGIGHLVGSSLPVGGESTHTILTGHSGMANQKMLSDLPSVKIGDVFYLNVLGEILAYQVDNIVTVLPENTEHLQIENGEDYCTLITCTPFGVNSYRLLVRGTRIPYVEEEKVAIEETVIETKSDWESQYFFGLGIGFAMIVLAGISAIIFKQVKNKKSSIAEKEA